MRKFIYKICFLSEWLTFRKKNIFCGTKKDIFDGYIHFSNKNQIIPTLRKYFIKKNNLILLKVDTTKLKKIIWEKSTNDKMFPHLYSCLSLKHVKSVFKIISKKNGSYDFELT